MDDNKVFRIDPTQCRCDEDEVQDYIDVMNGLSWDCGIIGGYMSGYRNTVAVNLTVASTMLGLDARKVLNEFFIFGLINPEDDDEDPVTRVDRCLSYESAFCWDWMINPEFYKHYGQEVDVPTLKVSFVIDADDE